MGRTGLYIALGIGLVTGLVFGIFPELDLTISRPFYDYMIGSNHFGWRIYPPLMIARDAGLWVGTLIIIPVLLALLYKLVFPRRRSLLSGRAVLFLTATMALGPGLLVNVALKDYWHRPRPIDVVQFGGNEHFRAWWDPRGDCPNNCAFVSGDVSGAFWTIAPAVLLPPPWRAVAVTGALALGTGMAVVRVMAGGHAASDVIFAGVFTFLVIWLVYALIYRWPSTRLSEEASERRLERFSARFRRMAGWFGWRVASEIAGPDGDQPGDPKVKRRFGWW
ncbi:MAG: phosphatase PAP2 family protein [Pseudolabrys sp.]|nr:phosphatase PAP2 family protein [Pseudolabrys sp.]